MLKKRIKSDTIEFGFFYTLAISYLMAITSIIFYLQYPTGPVPPPAAPAGPYAPGPAGPYPSPGGQPIYNPVSIN